MRPLRIELDVVTLNLAVAMSLHFPQKTVAKFFERPVEIIKENGVSDPLKLITLVYYADKFMIFPYYSPLRWVLITLFEEGAQRVFDSGNAGFAYFIVRCILRVTDHEVAVYSKVLERLSWSPHRRDKILYAILDDELHRKDWLVNDLEMDPRIIMELTPDESRTLTKNPNGRNVDLDDLLPIVRSLFYDSEPTDLSALPCDLTRLLDYLIRLGLIEKALELGLHRLTAVQIFGKIAELQDEDAAALYRAMVLCIAADPAQEAEIRAACVRAINQILRRRLLDSMPTSDHPRVRQLSGLCMIEDRVGLVTPENEDQLTDFVVVLGIGFCAADYIACADFFSQRGVTAEVRELFSLLWFVQWRYKAIQEGSTRGHWGDAALRLLAFPEFINSSIIQDNVDPDNHSADVYELYVNGSQRFEEDPLFPDFARSCSEGIQPRTLARITAFVQSLASRDVPHSPIMFSALVSHLIPWLRCGIPRALAGFECGENVPPELLDFGDFAFPSEAPRRIETAPEITIEPAPLPEPEPDDGLVELSSSSSPPPVRVPRPRRRSRRPIEKPRRRPKLRLLTADDVGPPPVRPMAPPQPAFYQPFCWQAPPVIPMASPAPAYNFGPIWDFSPEDWPGQAPPPAPPREEDRPPPHVQQQTQCAPPPEPPPARVSHYVQATVPDRRTAATQGERVPEAPREEPRQQPVIVFAERRPVHALVDTLDLSSTSEVSDVELVRPVARFLPAANPFPLDSALYRKVEVALDEAKMAPAPPELEDRPKFRPPPVHDMPVTRPRIEIPPPEPTVVFMTEDRARTRTSLRGTENRQQGQFMPGGRGRSDDEDGPDQRDRLGVMEWRPKLVSARESRVVATQDVGEDDFRRRDADPRGMPARRRDTAAGGLPTRGRAAEADGMHRARLQEITPS